MPSMVATYWSTIEESESSQMSTWSLVTRCNSRSNGPSKTAVLTW